MKKTGLWLLAGGASLMAMAAPAQATVVTMTFDGIDLARPVTDIRLDGFRLEVEAGGFHIIKSQSGNYSLYSEDVYNVFYLTYQTYQPFRLYSAQVTDAPYAVRVEGSGGPGYDGFYTGVNVGHFSTFNDTGQLSTYIRVETHGPRVTFDNFRLEGFPVPDEAASPAPEPATWATMLAGFGLVGAASRRRRATAADPA